MLVLAAGFCCAAPAMALSQADGNTVVTATTLPMKMSASVERLASSAHLKSPQTGKLSYGDAGAFSLSADATPAMRATPPQGHSLISMGNKTEPGIATLVLIGLGLLALRVSKQSSETFRD